MTKPITAITLKCPDCQANLGGENNSKAFFCLNCSFCFNVNVNKGKLDKYRLLYVKSQSVREAERIYFPFWQIESSYALLDQNAGEDTPKVRLFHIPAFFIKNINNFGDIGYYYLRKNIVPEPGNREKLEILPAIRDIQTAALYPDIYLRKEAGEITRGTSPPRFGQSQQPAFTVKHLKAAMALVPFYKEGHYYYDSILSWKYPTGAVI